MKPSKTIRERDVEQRLIKRCKEQNWLQWKFVSPAHRGVPDRLVSVHGDVHFVELKAPGEAPTPLQKSEHDIMRANGLRVWVLDTREAVDAWCAERLAEVANA